MAKAAEELVALLKAGLRKHEFCEGVRITEIVGVNGDRLNFHLDGNPGVGEAILRYYQQISWGHKQ